MTKLAEVYLQGTKTGEWVELPTTKEKIDQTMKNINTKEESGEWLITAYNGLKFVDEYDNVYKMNQHLQSMVEYLAEDFEGEELEKIATAILQISRFPLQDTVEKLEKGNIYFVGEYKDFESFVTERVTTFGYDGVSAEDMDRLLSIIDLRALERSYHHQGYAIHDEYVFCFEGVIF